MFSRAIENSLDRDTEDFELEVSSPGLDAPFKVKEQYLKNIGRKVEVLLKDGHTYKGILLDYGFNNFSVEITKRVRIEGKKKKQTIKEKVEFLYDQVSKVRVVITF
jgi:ribosome maturation factor RimP